MIEGNTLSLATMRFAVAVAAGAAMLSPMLTAQDRPSLAFERESMVSPGRVSVGADASGRKALCRELSRLARSSDRRVVSPIQAGVELQCRGDATLDVTLEYETAPGNPELELCSFAKQPISLFVPHMQAFALRSGAIPTAPYDLQFKLETVLVTKLGGLFEAMDFRNVAVATDGKPTLEVGVHELGLVCANPA